MTYEMGDITNGQVNFTTHSRVFGVVSIFLGGLLCLLCGIVAVFDVGLGGLPQNLVQVVVLDVGQGDATLIKTPSGADLLIDAGPNDSVVDQLTTALDPFDRTITMMLATHSDADHIGGFPAVLSRFSHGVFAYTGIAKKSAIRTELDTEIGSSTVWNLTAGDRIVLDPYAGVVLDVLWPPHSVIASTESDGNEQSLVLQLRYGSSAALFMGDAGGPTEQELVRCFGGGLASSFLKVGHHGSDSSTSEALLAAVMPVVASMSVGSDNKYGHPHPDVISRLEAVLNPENIHITKDEGQMTFVLSGAGMTTVP